MSAPAGVRLHALRPLTSACLVLLVVLLPALVAGVQIDAPARPGELERVAAALDPGEPAPSPLTRSFYGMTLADAAGAEPRRRLVAARRAQLLGIFGISGLLYLSVRLVRRRGSALMACLALAALPPVVTHGYVLRPETPAALFGALAVLLLQGLPGMIRSRQRPPMVRGLSQLALMIAVGTCLGLAVSALNRYSIYLLVPSAILLLTVVLLSLRFWQVGRRRGIARLPVRSYALRLLPWVGTAFFTLLVSWMLFASPLAPTPGTWPGTESRIGLLPETSLPWLVVLVLAGLGALGLVLRTGIELGRTARPSAAAVLLAWVAVLLLDRLLRGRALDALPAAPALAVLIAEGVGVLLVLLAPLAFRRAGRGTIRGIQSRQ